MRDKLWTVLKNGGLFLLLLAALGVCCFRKVDWEALRQVLRSAKPGFLLLGVAAMGLFLLCEAHNTGLSLRLLGKKACLPQRLRYAASGFFFSGITPSASGGQPMQLLQMHRDGIPAAYGTLALFLNLACYQLVCAIYAALGVLTQRQLLHQCPASLRILLAVGFLANLALLFLLLMVLFTRRLPGLCVLGLQKLLRAFHLPESYAEKASGALAEYRCGAAFLRAHPLLALRVLLTTFVQIAALHATAYLVCLSLGQGDVSFFSVFCLQAMLYVSVSSLPLPGAVGANEGSFLVLYRSVYPQQLLPGAMLLSRFISFYLIVALTGAALAVCALCRRRLQAPALVHTMHDRSA